MIVVTIVVGVIVVVVLAAAVAAAAEVEMHVVVPTRIGTTFVIDTFVLFDSKGYCL